MISALAANNEIKVAARVAHKFGLDPVVLLDDDGDEFLMAVRQACAQVISEDEAKAAEKQRSAQRSASRSRGGRRRP